MTWSRNPAFSATVLRRKAAAEFLDLLAEFAELTLTRGRSVLWKSCYPSNTAYWMAVSRLKKAGLIAQRRSDGGTPELRLAPQGEAHVSDIIRPEDFWKARWDGVWYLLSYDVPEADRKYRHTLRAFLKTLRMGQLHRSVWVTWRDIRPAYHDLCEAASVQDFAFLFEARTVLGMAPERIVRSVWPMDEVDARHARYLERAARRLDDLEKGRVATGALHGLARSELSAYRAAMDLDPLLPRDLWPAGYRGQDVYRTHRRIVRAIAAKI